MDLNKLDDFIIISDNFKNNNNIMKIRLKNIDF